MSCSCDFMKCFSKSNNDERNKFAVRLAATAYDSLSREERDRVYGDLHGTETTIVETPDFIASKLEEFDTEVGAMNDERKKYYMKALEMEQQELSAKGGDKQRQEEYIGSSKFRLMFLRAERFDARLAAKRLAMYFKHKYDTFGADALPRRIKQVDLNEEDKMGLDLAAFVHTGAKDVAGRPIIMARRHDALRLPVSTVQRIVFYVVHKVIEDSEVAQQKGIVWIGYNMMDVSPPPLAGRKYFPVASMLLNALPVRVGGIHNFYKDLNEHLAMNLLIVVMPRHYRARFIAHYQFTHIECMYKLLNYGINSSCLPLTDRGCFKYDLIREYWKRQRQLEGQVC